MSDPPPRVLILGAGINGCALARELALAGVSVTLVDTADVGSGTTAYSSRLIHGGLRYLEYRELDLVRESVEERTRLLRLAPQYVRPLRLFIPAARRLGGFRRVMANFLGVGSAESARPGGRGMWLVRLGLWLYDRYARGSSLPHHAVHRVGEAETPHVDAGRYRWLCSYYDAQVVFPERLVLAMLADAARLADERGAEFQLFTYHRATLSGVTVEIRPVDAAEDGPAVETLQPAAIINATGAWVDETLRRLHVDCRRLIAGTKGSHLFTRHPRLREALGSDGVYAEAADGRPVFLLPFLDGTLVGTTDLRFEGEPREAVASDAELDYLVEAVNAVVPGVELSRGDVALHYSGVRPLPHTDDPSTAAVTRRHWLEEHAGAAVPLYSVIGGKLTTCRSLAEESAATVLHRLGKRQTATSGQRPFPGGEDYPADETAVEAACRQIANRLGFEGEQVCATWRLFGTRTEMILASAGGDRANLPGTSLPQSVARWSIANEWARALADLVERRLMLLYDQRLSISALRRLVDLLVAAGHVDAADAERHLDDYLRRLSARFAIQLS